jgi:hypothetical protein
LKLKADAWETVAELSKKELQREAKLAWAKSGMPAIAK